MLLSFLNRIKRARSQKRKNCCAQTHHALAWHQHWTSENVGVHLVQNSVLLRNTAGIDHTLDRHSMFCHTIQNHASMERGALDGGKQFIPSGTPTADSPASIPVRPGWTLPCTTPHTPGTRFVEAVIPMMQVEVPTTFTTSSVRHPATIASQCASKAPTGIGMSAVSPRRSAHCGDSLPAITSDVAYSPSSFSRIPASSGSSSSGTIPAAIRQDRDSTATCAPLHKHCV